MTAPSAIVGPRLVGGRELDIAGGDQILGDDHGLGVGGDRKRRLTDSVILAWVPIGSIESMVPTFTPATRTSSPG